jgi:NAD-dependent DNA ligase
MKAGPEMNILIKEKVIGHCNHILTCKPSSYMQMEEKKGPHDWTMYECVKCAGRFIDEFKSYVPNYSTSIADAWPVVEKMKEKNWHAFVIALMAPHVGADRVPLNVFAQMLFDLTPLAICLAALKAVGYQEST